MSAGLAEKRTAYSARVAAARSTGEAAADDGLRTWASAPNRPDSLAQTPDIARADDAAPPTAAAPHRGRAPHVTEKQLEVLWRGRRFPDGALVTRSGVPVRVIYQGRRGRGAGPDFRGAVIAGPSGVPVRGDVELHVRASDFRVHNHHRDPAYRNIVLHVVFHDDESASGGATQLPGGGSAPVVALAPWVARRSEELDSWLARPLLWREPCHDAVMRLGADDVSVALDGQGDRRFGARVALLRESVRASGIEQALYESLLEALGYGGNAPQMLALARLLPWARLRGAVGDGDDAAQHRYEALLLGSAGLLPSQRLHSGPVEAYVEGLERQFTTARMPALPDGTWKLWGVRPENAPARRVAAAAALLASIGAPTGVLCALEATAVNEAIRPLLVRATGYWLTHHDVCAAPCRLPAGFVGRSRAIEMLLNAVLPIACASDDGALAARGRALFEQLPRPAVYGVTRFIEEALGSEGMRVPINARRAQGLLELQRNWCGKGGCGRCALSL